LKIFDLEVVKYCPNSSTSQQVNSYEKAVTSSVLPGQQCAGSEATVR